MVDKRKRRYKTVGYKSDDNVKVRIGYGGKKSIPKERFEVESKIFKKGKKSDDCEMLLIPSSQINVSELWFSTKDLISYSGKKLPQRKGS